MTEKTGYLIAISFEKPKSKIFEVIYFISTDLQTGPNIVKINARL